MGWTKQRVREFKSHGRGILVGYNLGSFNSLGAIRVGFLSSASNRQLYSHRI